MPGVSQLLGVKKGSNSSTTSGQGFSPFSRSKLSASQRSRQHLRTKSENSVVCANGHNGTRFEDISKRASPVVTIGYDNRESYESRYERYRQIYLATSPERELSTLNAAIVNVRKWLKKKHQCLQALKTQASAHVLHDLPQSAAQHKQQTADLLQSPADKQQQSADVLQCGADKKKTQNYQALLEKLVTEAGHQQEAVDVLLDRGRRYLHQRACITLEVDLENLAFLWNSYTKQLFVLHDQPHTWLAHLHPTTPQPEGKENLYLHSTPVQGKENLYLHSTPVQGKENLYLHSTPVKGRKAIKVGTPNKLQLAHTPEKNHSPLVSLDESGTGLSISTSENVSSSFAQSEQFALSASDQSDISFDVQKEAFAESQPSDQAETLVSENNSEKGKDKLNQELNKTQEASKNKGKENKGTKPAKTRRVLPQIPSAPRHSCDSGDKEAQTEGEKKAEEAEVCGFKEREGVEIKTGEKRGTGEKRSSSLSPRSKLIAASQWPAENKSGWLKVAGEGIFTSSSRPSRKTLTSVSDNPSSLGEVPTSVSQGVVCVDTCPPPGLAAGGPVTADRAVKSSLGKQGKEIHNEQQQKQERNQQEDNQQDTEELDQQPTGGADGNCSEAESDLELQLGLTASEENLKMEIEEALKEIQGSLDTISGDNNLMDLSTSLMDSSANDSSTDTCTKTSDNESCSQDDLDLPTGPKRRRMMTDPPGVVSSGSGSPLLWSGDSSMADTPTSSPAGTLPRDFRQRYKKDELWKAIESNYQYLMDKEIIETCQSTESGQGEDVVPNVSFTEFLKQYQELIDWLNQTQRNTQRSVTSLSEKYLNQAYHEEMLEKCPRREFLTKYSQQLLVRYPNLSDQVTLRMQRLNAQWTLVEAAITPQQGEANIQSMMQDLECDLAALRRWLNATESRLLPLTIRADWTDEELEERLRHHQVLQQDIESHSRIVSAVLKVSERVEREASCSSGSDCQTLQLLALNLERRWHGIWLQSLEWQCRLEEAINRRKGLYGSGFNFSGFTLPTLDESCGSSDLDLKSKGNITTSSNGSLIELSDDSLLFIGTRTEHHVGDYSSSGPASPQSLSRPLHSPTLPSPKLTNFLDRSSGDSANISECESKMGDSPRGAPLLQDGVNLSLSMSSDGEAEGRGRWIKARQEAKDIGYSSESQSNDETESMQQQLVLECRYPGIIEVCSDSPLGEKMTLPAPGAVRQDYYCMTHVDLDSTDKTTTDDGSTTDDRENQVGGHMESRIQEGQGRTALVGQGVALNKTGFVDQVDAARNMSPRGSHEDIAVKSYLESSDEVEGAHLTGLSAALRGNLSESDSAAESPDKIRYLIDHAEELVKTSPRSTVPGSPQRKMSPSKQTQTVITETSSVESSCDASSENSEESGAEEFSTATDDAEETLFDSVINLDSTVDSLTSREDVSLLVPNSITVDSARLRKQTGPRGGKKDRPWSVVGVQDLKKMDFQPLSTSESAIDCMRPHTDTDSSSSQFVSPKHASTFPRRTRHRGYQRAFSACEQSSPRATKRKLKYSSSSSATDSQASRSSATQVAASTEDEDDRTFVYDSAEQLRSSQGIHSCLLESESETTDEYVTASMDEVITSADEDPHNSTGSFSETAWDNYQMMYPTASEDATEEVLHWEPVDDMEFDDDFNFNFPKQSSSLLSEAISKRANKMRLRGMRSGDDSDSDMEDFRSVLEDSEKCLKVVDHSLKKKRTNPMGTGLASPGKYVEMLATCETNMECVKDVCKHLTQEDIGMGDVERVQDLLYQWERLHTVATDRHQQSHQLAVVTEALTSMKTALNSVTQCLNFDLFTSKEELETTITTLRVKQEQLGKQSQVLEEHRQVIQSFVQHHPSVNVTKYLEELHVLDKATAQTQHRVAGQLQTLEKNWAVWCEYLEGQKELDTLMAADRERLFSLVCQREAGHRITKMEVLRELETLQSNLCVYESKLSVLQAMRQRLTRVSDDDTQRSFLASLADLRNQLHVVSQRCRQMYRDVEEEEAGLQAVQTHLGSLAMSPSTLLESHTDTHTRSGRGVYDAEAAVEEGGDQLQVRQGRAWSWLRSLPVQVVALMMVAGLVYILDPDLLADLAGFSLSMTPELRHENGPSGL